MACDEEANIGYTKCMVLCERNSTVQLQGKLWGELPSFENFTSWSELARYWYP